MALTVEFAGDLRSFVESQKNKGSILIRRKAVKGRSKRLGSKGRHKFRRLPWPSVFEQRHYDIIGLGLVATAVFFSLIFYLSWDGGKVGDSLAWLLTYFLGLAAYIAPLALFFAGALLILRPYIPSLAPFRIGAICLMLALTLGFSAQAFGIGSDDPARQSVLYAPYLTDHGGLVGEVLYTGTSALFQRAGAIVISVFLAATGVLLLSGASISGVLNRSREAVSGVARRAGSGSHDLISKLEERLKQTDTYDTQTHAQPDMGVSHGTVAIESGDGRKEAKEEDGDIDVLTTEHGETVALSSSTDGDDEVLKGKPSKGDVGRTPQGNRRGPVTESSEVTYKLPGTGFLKKSGANAVPDTSNQKEISDRLVDVLKSFNVEAQVIGTVNGPHVTRYELQLAPGIKVAKVAQLKDDLAYALASTDIRIITPIPGKKAVGVEVPNRRRLMVHLGDIMNTSQKGSKGSVLPKDASPIAVWLGKDVAGKAVWTDLAQMPHIMVAGTTGSGKSGCINAMLSSMLLRSTPDEVRMVLIDPKQVELNYYESIPHLLAPLVTSPRLAANVLGNLVKEMQGRYDLLSEARCRSLPEFNRFRKSIGERTLPYIVCVVDELADLMMVASAEVEESITRLAQRSRAVGIHLLLATQRPSTDIITGTIKVNVPARIGFSVSSQIDSRVILDQVGAETLLGQGDMLFRPAGSSKLQRIQGAYITESEIAELTAFWCKQDHPDMQEELLETAPVDKDDDDRDLSPDRDELLEKAISLVAQTQTASVSMLQRRLRVGYTRAGRLIDMLERRGLISGYEGSKPRNVLISEADLGRVLADEGDKDLAEEPSLEHEPDLVTAEYER